MSYFNEVEFELGDDPYSGAATDSNSSYPPFFIDYFFFVPIKYRYSARGCYNFIMKYFHQTCSPPGKNESTLASSLVKLQ